MIIQYDHGHDDGDGSDGHYGSQINSCAKGKNKRKFIALSWTIFRVFNMASLEPVGQLELSIG